MPALWHPEVFQGLKKHRNYFEGWYFRHSDGTPAGTWAFIPGIALGARAGEGYAFVQAIEGAEGRSYWFEYPLSAFRASPKELDIQVGDNRFGPEGIHLSLHSDSDSISGKLSYSHLTPIPTPPWRAIWRPGVMGPFSFVPFMECRHGLVSLDHSVSGQIDTPLGSFTYRDGRGYIEKDWGSSMPSSWIWTQCNYFPHKGDSVMLSVARIPWMGSSFTGFLCAGSLGGESFIHATWSGARIAKLEACGSTLRCTIRYRGGSLGLSLGREGYSLAKGLLRAPVQGLLSRRISESQDARMEVLRDEQGRRYETSSCCAGLELAGAMEELGLAYGEESSVQGQKEA
jgi:hypothetical protein